MEAFENSKAVSSMEEFLDNLIVEYEIMSTREELEKEYRKMCEPYHYNNVESLATQKKTC